MRNKRIGSSIKWDYTIVTKFGTVKVKFIEGINLPINTLGKKLHGKQEKPKESS